MTEYYQAFKCLALTICKTNKAIALIGALLTSQFTSAWSVDQFCAGCRGRTVEFFIVENGGAGPFGGTGISNIITDPTSSDWSYTLVNPYYSIATSSYDNWIRDWTENYLGNQSQSVRVDVFMWEDDPLNSNMLFAASYNRINGALSNACQAFGAIPVSGCALQVDPTGVNYNRSAVGPVVPLPAGVWFFISSIIGILGVKYQKLFNLVLVELFYRVRYFFLALIPTSPASADRKSHVVAGRGTVTKSRTRNEPIEGV